MARKTSRVGRAHTGQRLPAIVPLAKRVRDTKRGKQSLGDSAAFLTTHTSQLAQWSSVEDVAVAGYGDEPPDKSARAIAYHIQAIREEIARELWSRGVFVGVTVIDELLF